MATMQLENVTRTYPPGSAGVAELNLRVADGEIVALVGPSGCGKTTTLRLIAGLETPTTGSVHLGDHDVTSWPPHRRNLAMAFQNPALYPHLNVRRNLEFGLRMRRIDPAIRAERICEIVAALDLQDMLERMPGELSGGE